jgi:Fe-S cluster assembly protein SufD
MANLALLEREVSNSSSNLYVEDLVQKTAAKSALISSDWLVSLRRKASLALAHRALPSRREEEWLFTDLSDLLRVSFSADVAGEMAPATLAQFVLPETAHSRLVFVNGHYRPHLSDTAALPREIYVGNLAGLSPAQQETVATYLAQQGEQGEFFTALNTAGLVDAAIAWLPKETVVESPIHFLFITVASPTPALLQPRVLVIAEANSQATLVESYGVVTHNCSDVPQKMPYLNNAVTEICLGENAQIFQVRNQRDSGDGFHLATTVISQAQNSRYSLVDVNLGSHLCRHNLEVWQQGSSTETNLWGLTAIAGRQVADTHSAIYLRHPQGQTRQLHKCIADDYAQGVFSGKIFVPQAAQMTNAAQLNRNLMLSPKARINTKPQLQITADNVKCSHGATISQLEADEIFYLQSRGLNDTNARHLLIDAFAGEIFEQIPLNSLRQRLEQCVACRTL